MRLVGLALLSSATAVAVSEGEKNAAIDKVVQMMRNMVKTGRDEKQKEATEFAAFKSWCTSTESEKTNDIKNNEKEIKQAKGAIEEAVATIEECTSTIAENEKNIDDMEDDIKTAKKVDTEAQAAFMAEQQDLNDSIYACAKATTALRNVAENVGGVSDTFLQTMQQGNISGHRWAAISSLLEEYNDPFALAQTGVSAAVHRSNTVIKMLEDLEAGFKTELNTLTVEEKNRKNAYSMMVDSANQEIENSKRIVGEKKVEQTSAEEDKGEAESTVASEVAAMKANRKYKAEVVADCTQKEKDFNGRQKSRAEEIEAIEQAIEIMTSPTMQAGAANLDSFFQKKSQSMIQLRTSGDATTRAIEFLREQSASLHSSSIMALVQASESDPFAKVKKMINDLIIRLKEEAKRDAEKKGFCDKEMAKNKANIEKYTADVNKLSATKDTLTGKISKAKKNIKKYKTLERETKTNLDQAKVDRNESKAENKRIITENEAASEAVEKAIGVLQNYYSQKGFIQAPQFEGGEYKGMGGAGGGVVGLLEVIQSDVRMMIEETRAQETAEAQSFAKLKMTSEQTISSSQASHQKNTEDLARFNAEMNSTKDDLKDAESQLESSQEAKANIDRQCSPRAVSFEEKDAKRKAEIQSLEEALKILANI